MVTKKKLREMAIEFGLRNPRFMVYGIAFIRNAVKAQQGVELTVEELQYFLKILTAGYEMPLETIKKHLEPVEKTT